MFGSMEARLGIRIAFGGDGGGGGGSSSSGSSRLSSTFRSSGSRSYGLAGTFLGRTTDGTNLAVYSTPHGNFAIPSKAGVPVPDVHKAPSPWPRQ